MTDVSRETSGGADLAPPPPPAGAGTVFGDRLGLAEAYAARLATDGVIRGLIGPREVPRLWDRHLLNCAVIAPLLAPGARVADLGSGAGLPGVVLAIVRPDLDVVLVEPLLRRSTFLEETIAALGLARTRVLRARAEAAVELRGTQDVVTARAVAPLSRLCGWALPLLRPGGSLIALKGGRAAAELSDAETELHRLGATHVGVETCGAGLVDPPTTVVCVEAGSRPARAAGGRSAAPKKKGQG